MDAGSLSLHPIVLWLNKARAFVDIGERKLDIEECLRWAICFSSAC
jgi:hypothetical protein